MVTDADWLMWTKKGELGIVAIASCQYSPTTPGYPRRSSLAGVDVEVFAYGMRVGHE